MSAVADRTAAVLPAVAAEWGRLAGLWHDLGKFRPGFQSYVRQDASAHVEGRSVVSSDKTHSAAGAIHALSILEKQYGVEGRRAAWLLAHLIAAHHAGLYDHSKLSDRLKGSGAEASNREYDEALNACGAAYPELLLIPEALNPRSALLAIPGIRDEPLAQSMWVRMLFSALVDADFLDTEAYFDQDKSQRRTGYPGLSEYLSKLDSYLDALADRVGNEGRSDEPVMQARTRVLSDCRTAALRPPGVFSLQVPTGGGKTLASLAFALRHAVQHGLERVIVAIPYTSIVEQTADVFAGIFGREFFVEHHSQADGDLGKETARSRLACENWDAPLIVTTNVQLFESLFAARTSRCRKIHRVQRSVIVLDEAQMLPPPFLQPTLDALRLLQRHYGATIVSCTATQPVLTDIARFDPRQSVRGLVVGGSRPTEIVSDVDALYKKLQRVRFEWPVDWSYIEPMEVMAARLAEEASVLAIVNTRRDAAELVRELDKVTPVSRESKVLHLSAAMCGQHRADVIDEIRSRLQQRREGGVRPLRVVSTQLIEAGVDVDFPVVFRALAGLDSIAQAAGRCNREGSLGEGGGRVVVFPREIPRTLSSLVWARQATVSVLGEERPEQLGPGHFTRYFESWYSQFNVDEKEIVQLLRKSPDYDLQFSTAAERYRLIDDADQISIVVPYEPVSGDVNSRNGALEALDRGVAERWQLRLLQRYIVQARQKDALVWLAQGDLREPMPGWFVLADATRYDERFGLLAEGAVLDPASLAQ